MTFFKVSFDLPISCCAAPFSFCTAPSASKLGLPMALPAPCLTAPIASLPAPPERRDEQPLRCHSIKWWACAFCPLHQLGEMCTAKSVLVRIGMRLTN